MGNVASNTERDIYLQMNDAVRIGNFKIARNLIGQLEKLDFVDMFNQPWLTYSLDFNNDKITNLLLDYGADVTVTDNKNRTVLHYAAKCVWIATLKRLASDTRLDINAIDYKGNTALHKAVQYHNVGLVLTMIEHGCNLNIQNNRGDTALHGAARYNMYECMSMLVEAGADTTLRNNAGRTPLDEAIAENHRLCIEKLSILPPGSFTKSAVKRGRVSESSDVAEPATKK